MNIAIAGLGLIGGSFCKALSNRTDHNIWGFDINSDVTKKALSEKSISRILSPQDFRDADILLICLHPEISIKFLNENLSFFKEGTIVADVCGVKTRIVNEMSQMCRSHNLRYVGTHPMAGREFGGYDHSVENLYDNRSFIITPVDDTDTDALETVKSLAVSVGFSKIVTASPAEHDKTIAYTSQLAHIVSSAYVKSPSIENEAGFTAGSFQDMTRIATVNEHMWTDLFMQNREPLLAELETLINNLEKYKEALKNSDANTMTELLREGRLIKEKDLSTYSQKGRE